MLPEAQRSALLLCNYQGFSNKEAADIMGSSVQALESLIARAKRGLRTQLEDFRHD
jgi:RNA polymerase sigma-70 factor (ECF subfamily)